MKSYFVTADYYNRLLIYSTRELATQYGCREVEEVIMSTELYHKVIRAIVDAR